MFQEFKTFILRGNVVDLAVGIVIGAAFGKVVTSFVNDILMPPIGVLLGQVDFTSLSFTLIDKMGDKPAVVISYGKFVGSIVDFLIVGFAIFLVVKQVNRMQKPKEVVVDKKDCDYCFSSIPLKATKCPHCTADLKR